MAIPRSAGPRVAYAVVFFVTAMAAWAFSHWAAKLLSFVPLVKNAPSALAGASAVYRVLGALALFHAGHAVAMLGLSSGDDPRARFHAGMWFVKLPLLVGLAAAMLFVPDRWMGVVSWIGLVLAAVFVLLQLVLVVGFAHEWASKWIEAWHASDSNTWYRALLAATAALFAVALAFASTAYALFGRSSSSSAPGSCGLNIAFITINLVVWIVAAVVSVLPRIQDANPRSGLLQSAAVAAYASYLVFSALLSENSDMPCAYAAAATGDGSSSTKPVHIAALVTGAVFTVVSVSYSATRLSLKDDELRLDGDAGESAPMLRPPAPIDDADAAPGAEFGADSLVYSVSWFHASFALAAAYVAMLLTNWALLASSSRDSLKVNSGNAAVWVQMVSSWVCLLLYMWTLIAPALFPNRDFS